MPNMWEQLQAHREAAGELRVAIGQLRDQVASLVAEVRKMEADTRLQALLRAEAAWLDKAEAFVREVRRLRQHEVYVWAVAILAAMAGFAAGHAWATRP